MDYVAENWPQLCTLGVVVYHWGRASSEIRQLRREVDRIWSVIGRKSSAIDK